MKKTILVIASCAIMSLGVAGCGQSDAAKSSSGEANDLAQSQNEYGSVEKENVETLVAKFNTEVMDNSSPNNSSLNPAMDDYLTETNDQYWYGLIEGIFLVVVPEKYTGDKTADIVDYMIIHVDKSSNYESDAVPYAKHLIKANRNDVTESEIATLLEEAKDKASRVKWHITEMEFRSATWIRTTSTSIRCVGFF